MLYKTRAIGVVTSCGVPPYRLERLASIRVISTVAFQISGLFISTSSSASGIILNSQGLISVDEKVQLQYSA